MKFKRALMEPIIKSTTNAIFASLCIHICFVCLLLYFYRSNALNFQGPKLLEIEVIDKSASKFIKKPKNSTTKGLKQKRSRSSRSSTSSSNLSRLGLNFHLSDRTEKINPSNKESVDFARSLDKEKSDIHPTLEVKSSVLFRNIHKRIDTHLVYPSELRHEKIIGAVLANFLLSKHSKIIPERTKIESNSRYLSVLVARTLRKAFKDPIHNFDKFTDHDFMTECVFKFEVTEHNDSQSKQEQPWLVGNQLVFYRRFQQTAGEWQAGPLKGFGPFLGLDILWFPTKIKETLSQKVSFDPLQSYRDDPAW